MNLENIEADITIWNQLWENEETLEAELKRLRFTSRKLEKYEINQTIAWLRKQMKKKERTLIEEELLQDNEYQQYQSQMVQLIREHRYDRLVVQYLDHLDMIHMTKDLLTIVREHLQGSPHEHQYIEVVSKHQKKNRKFICCFCGEEIEYDKDNCKIMETEIYPMEEGKKLGRLLYRKRSEKERTK